MIRGSFIYSVSSSVFFFFSSDLTIEKDKLMKTTSSIRIDFGLSQKYLDKNGKHVPPGKSVRYGPGTVEFMSIRAHKTNILSRRDDIEGLGYLILYFLQGVLPWAEYLDNDDYEEMSNLIHKKKKVVNVKVCIHIYKYIQPKMATINYLTDSFLFRFKSLGGHAGQMAKYFKYARELGFEAEPDYKYLRKLLDEILS